MKKLIVCLNFILTGLTSLAQSEEIKQYLKQIAANADHIQQLLNGIRIARSGLNTISAISNGELNLHVAFFKGLSNVNPRIKNLAKVADIISFQVNIVKSYSNNFKQVKASGQFTEAEIKYIHGVFSRLLNDCTCLLAMLADVMSNDGYKMSDDERIAHIEKIYASMQSSYRFTQQFSHSNLMMALQKMKEQAEVSASKKLFDTH
jgi:hypothetical protein